MNLFASSVLSGNRNFEGRVNPLTKANYLASPPLVVAYALAGTTDIDLVTEPLGKGSEGDVYLKDVWPSQEEVQSVVEQSLTADMFQKQYGNAFDSNEMWNKIETGEGALYEWSGESTYIQEPPFLAEMTPDVGPIQPIEGARCLVLLKDSVTTDHISPAGAIAKDSPAGQYLQENKVETSRLQ